MLEDEQGTVPQAVHCMTPGPAMHMKYSVNNVSGAEQWGGLGGNIELIVWFLERGGLIFAKFPISFK